MTIRIRTLFVLFAVSGFCGLIYESIWSHYLKLFLGHAAYAQTVVLIVFIGGLALGSWLTGHFVLRMRRPLVAYAAAEFLVGVAALVFHFIFVASTDWAYDRLLPALCSTEGWCWPQWLLAAALILPQSILLGTTFPLMSSGILRLDGALPGAKLALLYFLNSIGAVAGVLASGYVLIPGVGMPGALFTAGMLNVLVAIVVYFLDKNTLPARQLEAMPAGARADGRPGVKLLLAVALLTGLSSFIYEIVWVRSLSLVLGSSTHSFELMLASFILGLALGGLWIRGRVDRVGRTTYFLAIVQIVMGALALLTLPVYSGSFDLMAWLLGAVQRSESGWVMFNLGSALICVLVMLPATFMAGMTLPLITFALLQPLGEKSIGHVYAANTIGGILGVIIAVHFALPVLGLKGALVLGGAIDVGLGVFMLARFSDATPRARAAWSASGVVMTAIAALFFHLDPMKLASGVYKFANAALTPEYEVLFHRDGKTASVDVFEHRGMTQLSIATNGKVDGAIVTRPLEKGPGPDEYTMILLAALPFAHQPDAKTVAVIGYGTGLSTATVLGAPRVERVDTVEIEPAMVEGARAFAPVTHAAYDDPRSHIVIDDAKSYFARSGRKYDVIVSEPSNPWVSGVSSLFTREFYVRARSQLNASGIFVQWLHTYAFNEALLASVVRAMREAFADFVVYVSNRGDLIIVASASGPVPPLRPDIFRMQGLAAMLDHIEIRRMEDIAVRRIGDDRLFSAMFNLIDSPPNSDYFPIVDTHAGKLYFLDTFAGEVMEVGTAPWPILEMMRKDEALPTYPITLAKWPQGERVREAQRAEHARAFLLGQETREEAHVGLGPYYRPLAMFKLRFVECQASVAPEEWRDAMIVTAGLVSVYLSREASGDVWNRVEKAPCHAALDEETRGWFDLFRALGRRDAARTATIAGRLLAARPNPATGDLEYLYGAAMTALIALDRKDEARRLFDEYHGRLAGPRQSLGWFRWIRSSIAR